jgi:hypothetical protein
MNLDDALQAWATQEVALPGPVADDIFRTIVTSTAGLDTAGLDTAGLDTRWWTRFSGQLAATVVASTRPRRPVMGLGS